MANNPIVHNLFPASSQKKPLPTAKPKSFVNYKNPFEALPDFNNALKKTATDQLKGAKQDVMQSLFGVRPKGGDLAPGQELDLKAHKQEQKALGAEPAINYAREILDVGKKPAYVETRNIAQEVQNLVNELKGLAASTKTLEKEITEATGHTIVTPGKYHKTFLQHLLSIVHDAREKIENAGTWMNAMKGKQKRGPGMSGAKPKKQNNFWGKVKKSGSQYLMSGEHSSSRNAG
jgi:hypothetical protein